MCKQCFSERTNLWNSEFQVKKVGIFYNDEALSIAYCCLRSRPIYLNVVCQSVRLPLLIKLYIGFIKHY